MEAILGDEDTAEKLSSDNEPDSMEAILSEEVKKEKE